MDQDEDLARKLQTQFDAEVRAAEVQERRDAAMVQNLASQSHLMSDSEEEEAEAAENRGKGVQSGGGDITGAERGKASRARGSDDKKKITPSANTVRLEHTLSDEEDQDAGGCVSEPESKHISGLQGNSTQKTQEKKPDGESGGSKMGATKLPLCKFGSSCYRKNPWHLQEFYHPHLDGEKATNSSGSLKKSSSEPPRKRSRESTSKKTTSQVLSAKQPFPARLLASSPFNFFLNKTYSVKETQDDPLTLVLPDILSQHMGDLVESAQLNFMVDLEFLMSNYKAVGQAGKPLLVMYGELGGNPRDYPGLTCTKVNIPFQYGTHHTKMMMLQYKASLRVVIHTANLVPDDWYEKTQGYWVSPIFPELENGKSSVLDGESPTRFKRDLVEYLQSYKAPDLTRWSHLVKRYDFTTCNVFLVGSSPGYHTGEHKERWGHMKVRRVLHQHAATWQSSRPIITQCSSIGSLGKDDRTWLSGELGLSLTGAQGTCVSPPNVRLIYPSEDDVFNSSQGWMGGSCLPYTSNTHEKQSWLIRHLHVWRSEQRRRTRAMPHIKTYTRASKTHTEVQFLLLTSANLSKAAWGTLQKQNSQLFIRSYEVGVLLLPKFVTDSTEFKVGAPGTSGTLALPYDLPLTPYPDGAKPWFKNTTKKRKDSFGQTYLE